MIRITGLTKFFGEQHLFSDVDFTIGEKDKLGIIGRNGTGKSTFFNILLGSESADDGKIDIPAHIKIRALEQHVRFSEKKLLDQVCKSLDCDINESDESWKAKSILMGLGFTEQDFEKAPEDFSSGMQIRIRLAQALVGDCDLLLLDEPTNYLDIISLRWLERFLQSWTKAFVIISHDQQFMTKVVSHSVALHRGKMRKMKGGPKKLMEQIMKDEEVFEKTRQNMEKKKKKTEHFIKNFRAGARSAGLVQSRIKSLEKQDIREKLDYLPKISFAFKPIPFRGNTLLELFNIDFAYPQEDKNIPAKKLINQFNIEIGANERIAIIGKNGKGKSTLLRLMSQHLSPTSGHLKKYHTLETKFFGDENKKQLEQTNTILTELLSMGKINEQQARTLAGSLLFTGNSVKKYISNLSGGEKSRVSLGKVMLSPCHLLFLDEPTNHLDMESVQELTKAMKNFDGSIVFVSHDEELLSQIATKLIIFEEDGVVIKDQNYQQFLEAGGWGDGLDLQEKQSLQDERSDQKKLYLERKEQQKKLRSLQSQQERKEDEQVKIRDILQKISLEFEKACKKKNYEQMKELGGEIKNHEEKISQLQFEIEKLFEEEIELEEMMEES